jgi:hypothetical protein
MKKWQFCKPQKIFKAPSGAADYNQMAKAQIFSLVYVYEEQTLVVDLQQKITHRTLSEPKLAKMEDVD